MFLKIVTSATAEGLEAEIGKAIQRESTSSRQRRGYDNKPNLVQYQHSMAPATPSGSVHRLSVVEVYSAMLVWS